MVGLFVAAARDVEFVDSALATGEIEAREDRYDHHALHGHRQVPADHLTELVGLAFEAECRAFDLFVVFQLELEQFHHLDRRARGTGDCDTAVPVGREDLFERAVADQVA